MTLDPVHVNGIARLAGRVSRGVDEDDQQDVAETVWTEFLDPLYRDGTAVLGPMDELVRHRGTIADLALQEPPFPSRHGLDSGTINPTTFKNGLVIDVSQAAMAAVPSDMELHRGRTIVLTVHSTDDTYVLASDAGTVPRRERARPDQRRRRRGPAGARRSRLPGGTAEVGRTGHRTRGPPGGGRTSPGCRRQLRSPRRAVRRAGRPAARVRQEQRVESDNATRPPAVERTLVDRRRLLHPRADPP